MALSKGSWAATAASSELVPANDVDRGEIVVQLHSGDNVFLGIGEPAVEGEGIMLSVDSPVYVLPTALARKAIYGICASGESAAGGYQEGAWI